MTASLSTGEMPTPPHIAYADLPIRFSSADRTRQKIISLRCSAITASVVFIRIFSCRSVVSAVGIYYDSCMTITVRTPTSDDMDAVRTLYMSAQRYARRKQEPAIIESRIRSGTTEVKGPDGYVSNCFVAEDESRVVVGWALVSSVPGWALTAISPASPWWRLVMRRIIRLNSIAVLPSSQGEGVGKALVNAVADWGRPLDARILMTSPSVRNEKAAGLYASLGGSLVEPMHGFRFPTQIDIQFWYAFQSMELRIGAIPLLPSTTITPVGPDRVVTGVFD